MTVTWDWERNQEQRRQELANAKNNPQSALSAEERAAFERRDRENQIERDRLANEVAKMNDAGYAEQVKLDRARTERNKDLEAGRIRGQQQFGEGSLGRIDQATIDALRNQAGGFSNEEQNAFREQNLSTINQANQGNLRQMRIQQAAQGVRGGQATAQIAKMRNDQGAQIAQSERELYLKNIDAKRAGQQAYIEAQKYQNDMLGKEKMAQAATELGYGSLGSADRGAVMQSLVGEKQAQAAANSGGGGGGGLCFITTVVCEYMGLPDDNEFLNTFRRFRDEHMGGKNSLQLQEYYETAPKIVEIIKDNPSMLSAILELYLAPAFLQIKMGQFDYAHEIYSEMFQTLKSAVLSQSLEDSENAKSI